LLWGRYEPRIRGDWGMDLKRVYNEFIADRLLELLQSSA